MRFALISTLCAVGLTACDRGPYVILPDAFCDHQDMKTSADMTSSPVKCAAAKNLGGDNIICIDLDKVSGLSDQQLVGWNFSCTGTAMWTTAGGMLQVSDFANFTDECTAKLPAINLNDANKSQYKTLAISMVHRIDLNDPEQTAQMFLNDSSKPTRLMYQTTGKKDVPQQKTVIEINKADLPANINNSPQWLLKLSSSLKVGRNGWQIESIAVNASP